MDITNIVTALLAAAAASAAPNADETIIRNKILAGAAACMAGRAADVTRDYGKDLILQYPGAPDQGRDQLTRSYPRLCGPATGMVETTVPQFEEIYVSGRMAIVRVIWTTHLRGSPPEAKRSLRDFQVWERRAGQWTFVRGVHYPHKPAP